MNSRDVLKALLRDGWYEVNQAGSHKQFKHPMKRPRDRTAPEKGHTHRHTEEHREAGRNQVAMTPPNLEQNYGLHCLSPQRPQL